MSTTLATTTATTESTVAEGSKALTAYVKAVEAYSKAVGTFKSKTVATVMALRLEGYDDRTIATALRAVVEKHGISRQHLNRVLTAPAAEGGAGMEHERKHERSGSKSVRGKLAKDAAKGGVTVDLGDANSLFAALLTHFDGKAVKVMTLAEKLSELAQQQIERAAKAAK